MGVYRCGWPRVVALNFQSNSSTGATRHVYDIFGEIVTDYSDIVRVFFDICTSSTTSVRDSFDIVREYYVFVRVYKFAQSVSRLYI